MTIEAASSTGVHTLPSALLLAGVLALGSAMLIALVTWMRRRATRQWEGETDLLDSSYGATLKSTLYRAARVKWLTYTIMTLAVAGLGLLLASGVAKLFG